MNGIRIVVMAFCILVVIASVWTLSGVVKSLNLLKPQLVEQADLLNELHSEEKALSETWLDFDAKQRAGRANYDGPEAVDASYETQLALQALNQAKTVRESVETKVSSMKSQQRHTASWITPLIVLGLIHIIILAGLWPKKKKSL